MEPVTILACVNGALGITIKLEKIIKFLTNISTQFRFADVKVAMLIGYLNGLKTTLKLLPAKLKIYDTEDGIQELLDVTDSTLELTEIGLSFLETNLEPIAKQYEDGLNVTDKLKLLLKTDDFSSYLDNIDKFVNFLNLLLNVLAIPNPTKRQSLLQDQASRTIFKSMEDATSSILCMGDHSSMLDRRSFFSETSIEDKPFDFDADILRSRPYVTTYLPYLKRGLHSKGTKGAVVQSTKIPAVPMTSSRLLGGMAFLRRLKLVKDVPDTTMIVSNLNQKRDIGLQQQTDFEPQADTIRGTAAILRSMSAVRSKRGESERRKIYEDGLRLKLEPKGYEEIVEWDGLRRRKTIVNMESLSLRRNDTLHVPLGISRFPDEGDEEDHVYSHTGNSISFKSPLRQDTNDPKAAFDTPSLSRSVFVVKKFDKSLQGDFTDLQHAYDTPSHLKANSEDHESQYSSNYDKPVILTPNIEEQPEKLLQPGLFNKEDNTNPARRQFSFQRVFNGPRIHHQRQIPRFKTEEERLGLVRGDDCDTLDEGLSINDLWLRSTDDHTSYSAGTSEMQASEGERQALPVLPEVDTDDTDDDSLRNQEAFGLDT